MVESAALPLAEWESFYVIIGSSAAALTGLMFVVIAVVADAGPRASSDLGIATFVTPTAVHFCAALLISSVLSAPWHGPTGVAIVLGVSGAGGLVYSLVVLRRVLKVQNYKMVLEDWVWHTLFPILAYGAIAGSALALREWPVQALFVIAGSSVLLVFIGIHNSWDTVTHLTLQRLQREKEKQSGDQ